MHKAILILLLFPFWTMLVSCDGADDAKPGGEKTAEQLAVEDLTDGAGITWVVTKGGSVSKDGNSVISEYSGFELRLNSGTTNKIYTTTDNAIFDQNGYWSFAGGNFDKIELTGSQPAAEREISFTRADDKLTLMFNIPMPGANRRVNGVAGSYVFVLVKKQ